MKRQSEEQDFRTQASMRYTGAQKLASEAIDGIQEMFNKLSLANEELMKLEQEHKEEAEKYKKMQMREERDLEVTKAERISNEALQKKLEELMK